MDLKIGAVFSLANVTDGTDENPNNGPFSEVSDMNPGDRSEDEEYFIKNDDYVHLDTIEDMHNSSTSSQQNLELDESTESTVSDSIDPDCPPFLSIETSPHALPAGVIWQRDDMLPPVLEPQRLSTETDKHKDNMKEPLGADEDKNEHRRKCTRIYPSYAVLISIQRIMKNEDHISYRKFKRLFKGCTNMCKKVHFRRRLEAGKNVFNVCSPSKQKLPIYSTVHEKFPKINKNGAGRENSRQRVVNSSPRASKTNNACAKPSAARVQRVIQHLPKDFKMDGTDVMDIFHNSDMVLKFEERIKMKNEKMMKQIRVKELNNLKAQIKMKRYVNTCAKSIKKLEGKRTTLVAASGTSFKGRKRKTTTRYGPEFILDSAGELQQYLTMTKIEKRLERMKEDLNQRKQRMIDLEKGKHSLDVGTDNPEGNKGKRVKMDKPNGEVKQTKDALNSKVTRNTKKDLMRGKAFRKMTHSKENDVSGDSVLIRDLPNENQFISDILCTGHLESVIEETAKRKFPEVPKIEKVESACSDLNAYPYAKSLLHYSLDVSDSGSKTTGTRTSSKPVNILRRTKTFITTPELEKEKAEVLRIPESVQKLFKVKTEPVDDGYEASMYAALPNEALTSTTLYSKVEKMTGLCSATSTKLQPKTNASPCVSVSVPVSLTSPQGTQLYMPTLVPKPVSAPFSNSLILQSGVTNAPVKLKTGPNGGQLVTVLVSVPSAIPQQHIATIAQGSQSNILNSKTIHTSTAPITSSIVGVQNFSPTRLGPASQVPFQINVMPPRDKAVSGSMLNVAPESQTSTTPHSIKLNSSQVIKQTETKGTSATNMVHRILVPTASSQNTAQMPQPFQSTLLQQPAVTSTSPASGSGVATQAIPVLPMSPVQTSKQPPIGDKCKFVLLKMDGKNILIPMNSVNTHLTTPPKALLLDNTAASFLQSNNKLTQSGDDHYQKAKFSVEPGHVVVSTPSTNPAVTVAGASVLHKPTATVAPKVMFSFENKSLLTEGVRTSVPAVDTHPVNHTENNSKSGIECSTIVSETVADKCTGKWKRKRSDKSKEHSTENCTQETKRKTEQSNEKTDKSSTGNGEAHEAGNEGVDIETEMVEMKEKPFSEVVTDREERLRKLKELLREKQKAVEDIRVNRHKIT